ncbi:heat shock transcription factor protein [Dioscorea alata]|uniref:Heat shock transcription factor protein n=1 Tax=Dioscorea alata TaxID=55571 RepID=A0ACB7V242_DIOAL|nr:heat shock transcription factor protein [Dioscorea alata]
MAFMVDKCGEMVVNMDSHKTVPAPFLTKTYQLVDDPLTNHIVSWGEDDTTFVVWRPPEFARDLLPNYFKHNNFSSFVRQLNTYGFRKIVADRWEFANEFFRKGEKHLLSEIHRRKTPQISQQFQQEDHQMATWIDCPVPLPGGDTDYISALSEDNRRLRRRNLVLLSELNHMKKLYNDIIYFLQNHVSPVVPASSPSGRLMEIGDHDDQLQCFKKPSSSSISIAGESADGAAFKLFGVHLHGKKKRLHQETSTHVEDHQAQCHLISRFT